MPVPHEWWILMAVLTISSDSIRARRRRKSTGPPLTQSSENSFDPKHSRMNSTDQHNENCIFCKILRGKAPSETIYENDDVACIKDIHPASAHHYLIIPKVHVENAKVLKPEDEHILKKMLDTVKLVSERHGLDPASTRTGFHWPPFTTVRHLHLHLISPVENMNFIKRIMFKPNSFWFVSTEYVQSRFQS